ncbi:hypothetical protein QP028_15320 [Corynebacterium suedekumii]|nr:hypothetical protein QP028_15320 [Corynebacterium suedekumii]
MLPDDPVDLFIDWLRRAVAAGVPEPHAATRGLRKIGTEIHANDIPVSILAWIGLAKKRNARRKAFAVWGNG